MVSICDKPRQYIEKQRYYFADKGLYSKTMFFPVVMYGCDSWTIMKTEHWTDAFWTVVLEKTLESPLGCKETKPVSPNGNQPWIFIGRTDAEASILWPPDEKNQLIRKDPDAGKDWRQEEKGMTEDEMVGWHHWFNGCEAQRHWVCLRLLIVGILRVLKSPNSLYDPFILDLSAFYFVFACLYILFSPMLFHWGGHVNPLQYSYLENPMDEGAWQATVHRVTKSWT